MILIYQNANTNPAVHPIEKPLIKTSLVALCQLSLLVCEVLQYPPLQFLNFVHQCYLKYPKIILFQLLPFPLQEMIPAGFRV